MTYDVQHDEVGNSELVYEELLPYVCDKDLFIPKDVTAAYERAKVKKMP